MKSLFLFVFFSFLVSCGENGLGDQSGFFQNSNGTNPASNRCYYDNVMKEAPIGYWRLEETSGTAVFDSSGSFEGVRTSNATTGSTGAISTAESNNAFNFSGTSSYVSLGNSAGLAITGDQTIEFWVRPANFSARRNPFARAYGGTGTITQETNGTLNYYYGTNGGNGTPYQGFNSSTTLTIGNWHHIVLVRDLTNMQLHWYINGALVRSQGANYAAAVAGGNTTFIGAGYVNDYAGLIDDVALYNTALSGADVLRHYQVATGPCQ